MNIIYKIGYYTKNLIPIAFLISIIIFVFGFKQIYYLDIGNLNIPQKSGISREIIKESYDYLIDYSISFENTKFEIPSLPSSENGIIHFVEVRNIIQMLIRINIAIWLASSFGVIYCWKNKYHKIFLSIFRQLILIPVILSIPFIVNFSRSFVVFHKILFRNDYWIFDERIDPVIKILPEEFFFHEAMFMLSIILGSSFTALAIYKYIDSKKHLHDIA